MLQTLFKPLLGIGVELAISWLLLWLIERRSLNALGLLPTKRRVIGFVAFFFLTALCCATQFFMRMLFAREQWQLNPGISTNLVIQGTWWTLMSVLYEELIFRGALLYILIRRTGPLKAMIISSVAFGIYHWFSYGQLGNYQQMTITFISTGTFGLLLAYAYYKTSSLFVPISIHFGWNLVNGFIFSQGPIGKGIFIPVAGQPQVSVSYFTFLCIMVLPIVTALLLNYFLLKKQPKEFQLSKREVLNTKLSGLKP